MNRKIFYPIIVIHSLFFAVSSIEGCLKEQEFNQVFAKQMKNTSMKKLIAFGTALGKGNFGEVHEIKWGEKLAAVKKVELPTEYEDIKAQEFEIDAMKKMEGKKVVVGFFGCMENYNNLYIVQEKLYNNLRHPFVFFDLRTLPFLERLKKYIRITEIFSKLHENNIIHSDIKQENIMAVDPDLSDFRIFDLGLSLPIGKRNLGGSPPFNSPEKIESFKNPLAFSWSHYKIKSHVNQDVYALAMTIAMLETTFYTIISGVDWDCFEIYTRVDCHSKIISNIKENFEETDGKELAPILIKGLQYKAVDRIQSMIEFGKLLTDLLNEQTEIEKKQSSVDPEKFKNPTKSKLDEDNSLYKGSAYADNKSYIENEEFLNSNRDLILPNLSEAKEQRAGSIGINLNEEERKEIEADQNKTLLEAYNDVKGEMLFSENKDFKNYKSYEKKENLLREPTTDKLDVIRAYIAILQDRSVPSKDINRSIYI